MPILLALLFTPSSLCHMYVLAVVMYIRGIQPRAVRAAVIGFPNVGKSALINRLLGRKMAQSKNLPGVTRSLR